MSEDIEFKCVGFWRAGEVGGVVEERFGFCPEVSTTDGMVIVHPRPRTLSAGEAKWLEQVLASNPQKFSEERMVEFEVAEEARREELVAQVRKFTNGSEISMNVKDIRDALRAVAELAGIEL